MNLKKLTIALIAIAFIAGIAGTLAVQSLIASKPQVTPTPTPLIPTVTPEPTTQPTISPYKIQINYQFYEAKISDENNVAEPLRTGNWKGTRLEWRLDTYSNVSYSLNLANCRMTANGNFSLIKIDDTSNPTLVDGYTVLLPLESYEYTSNGFNCHVLTFYSPDIYSESYFENSELIFLNQPSDMLFQKGWVW